MIEYLLSNKNGVKYVDYIITTVEHNDLELIRKLHTLGYPIDKKAILKACELNNLPVVKFFHSTGFVFTHEELTIAKQTKNIELIEFIKSTHPKNTITADKMDKDKEFLVLVKFIHENKLPIKKILSKYAKLNNHTETRSFIKKNFK
jgi:hypothetical protein